MVGKRYRHVETRVVIEVLREAFYWRTGHGYYVRTVGERAERWIGCVRLTDGTYEEV